MPEFWRLTRNPNGRRVYEWLAASGIRFSIMQRYARGGLRNDRDDLPERSSSSVAVRLAVERPCEVGRNFRDADRLDEVDVVVAAYRGQERVGSVLLTTNVPVYVHALERRIDPEGAYVWRLYVAPSVRRQGLASALLETALRAARERGVDRATALVASDNVPSQQTFIGSGFQQVGGHRYLRLGKREWRF